MQNKVHQLRTELKEFDCDARMNEHINEQV